MSGRVYLRYGGNNSLLSSREGNGAGSLTQAQTKYCVGELRVELYQKNIHTLLPSGSYFQRWNTAGVMQLIISAGTSRNGAQTISNTIRVNAGGVNKFLPHAQRLLVPLATGRRLFQTRSE